MSPSEACLFRSFVSCTTSYLEFGAGGSTVFAASHVKGPVYSIESDAEWIAKVRSLTEESKHKRAFILADVGETKEWGYPVYPHGEVNYLNYHAEPWGQLDESVDFYFIDGRFRVSCFCQSLLRSNDRSFIAIHDYRSRRPYHVIESLTELVAESEDLSIFRRRQGVFDTQINAVLDEYKFNPV